MINTTLIPTLYYPKVLYFTIFIFTIECQHDPQYQLGLVNAQRANAQLPPLTLDDCLQKSAQRQSEYQAYHKNMTHDSDLGTLFERMEKFGVVNATRVAENVAMGQQNDDQVMTSWMNSPGHRANILGNYTRIGFGYAKDSDGAPYWTQHFTNGDCDPSQAVPVPPLSTSNSTTSTTGPATTTSSTSSSTSSTTSPTTSPTTSSTTSSTISPTTSSTISPTTSSTISATSSTTSSTTSHTTSTTQTTIPPTLPPGQCNTGGKSHLKHYCLTCDHINCPERCEYVQNNDRKCPLFPTCKRF
ncbi:hypothetical protein DLAC_08511 [Tieghemostelium lacteum]|uniref:SCP domain-containing protein n=1 Tax=Tieghemostelium lacteum TaxID=361077 RepID=A0A151Z7K1_TIELA|nr:hypothetical protein DLAC_08511 [Tieghemostelium lacteum]|eukprot:KYQ89940.1 hypothetical protein DLAC_08511 [Tieghemostelium lacteum]